MTTEPRPTPAAPVEPDSFRHVLGHFCTGVTVVASVEDDVPIGFACQSFTSLSLEPPLVALSISHESTTWPRIREVGRFCANVLASDQQHLAKAFGVSGGDKFAGVHWTPSPGGVPIIEDVLAWIDGLLVGEYEGGDHTIALAEVTDLAVNRDTEPLLFFKGRYGTFAL